MVACHAQSYLGAEIAVQAGVDTIEHGTRLDDRTIEELVRAKKIFLVPTLCTISSVLELSSNEKQLEEMRANAPLWQDSFQRAHDAGVKIAAGGDVGNRYVHGQQAKELEFLVENGFTEMEALIASTKTASEALGLASLIGTVEQGQLGDLLITNSNPLRDIRVLQNREEIYGVVKEGQLFSKQTRISSEI
jgi:imidazolonepropionase-like amidohydrolase